MNYFTLKKRFEQFGEWFKKKTGYGGDDGFVNAFATALLTVFIGAMAVVGAIQDGITNDFSTPCSEIGYGFYHYCSHGSISAVEFLINLSLI